MLDNMAQILRQRNAFRPIIITEDKVGTVTVHYGPSLPSGGIVAPTVGDAPSDPETYHNNSQNPENF
ncbi:hypothetical protein SOJ16_000142 [Caldicellulosiruptor danielii]|uniref:Uncharacterized protein n=1 Tax=Anaerocellum danielii TaxID=1387557 RepID=A0ABZ0U5G9_9FIRM|nr:hypothetical protein [Caldicellulosiruptor danielii]WPX08975.1 hypothetical protein SOJ16_000142 [Caldicellulosiruptor danielii]